MEKSGKTTIDQTLVRKTTVGSHSGQRAQSSSSVSRAPTDERKPFKFGSPRAESLPGLLRQKTGKNLRQKRRVTSGTLPCA